MHRNRRAKHSLQSNLNQFPLRIGYCIYSVPLATSAARPVRDLLVFVYVYKTSVVNMCPNAHLTCNPDLRADFHVRMALGCGEDNNPNTEIDENSESEDSDEQEPEPDWDE